MNHGPLVLGARFLLTLDDLLLALDRLFLLLLYFFWLFDALRLLRRSHLLD